MTRNLPCAAILSPSQALGELILRDVQAHVPSAILADGPQAFADTWSRSDRWVLFVDPALAEDQLRWLARLLCTPDRPLQPLVIGLRAGAAMPRRLVEHGLYPDAMLAFPFPPGYLPAVLGLLPPGCAPYLLKPEEKIKLYAYIASMLVHQVNNVLTPLIGYGDLARAQAYNDPQRISAVLQDSARQARRIRDLIDAFSRARQAVNDGIVPFASAREFAASLQWASMPPPEL